MSTPSVRRGGGDGPGRPAPWRIATFNIRHGLGRDGRVDLARTARAIAALRADAVGLQEVDVAYGPRSGHEDQASWLAELLGWEVAFGAALDLPALRPDGPRRRYGVALLTPHALMGPEMHALPAHPGAPARHEPRGVLHAQVTRGGGDALDLLVTHLDNDLPQHRTAEVLGILRRAEGITGPAVLLGDLNAAPHRPELAPLAAAGWREAADELRGPGRGSRELPVLSALTGSPARPTHPARVPVRRIDSLWVRGAVDVLDLATGALTDSDHRPVVATLRTRTTLDEHGSGPEPRTVCDLD
ncbi:endonuclease/exonuclease/phosphatase family protein [Brachybacterium paraconglomeratum]|uniref:endonuclease/exonuclease/phosphatase family protein n=1 Tax=Brachybacterium paraconglomeratum TaxID=173362 RepID=UPI00387A54C0